MCRGSRHVITIFIWSKPKQHHNDRSREQEVKVPESIWVGLKTRSQVDTSHVGQGACINADEGVCKSGLRSSGCEVRPLGSLGTVSHRSTECRNSFGFLWSCYKMRRR